MAMHIDMAIAEKRAAIRAHIDNLQSAYGYEWGDHGHRSAKTRLGIVADASTALSRLGELETEMAHLLAKKHELESQKEREAHA